MGARTFARKAWPVAVLLVAAFSLSGEASTQQEAEVFVTAELSKAKAYVGEQVILTYKLFTQVPVVGVQVDEKPPFTGFWTEDVELSEEPEWNETRIKGKRFFVVDIKRKVLFPTGAGEITIEPAVFSFFTDPSETFSLHAPRQIRKSTDPLTLRVEPLPSRGRPGDFSGAVGEFELRARLDREAATAGASVTLSVIVEGKGNLKTVGPPRLPSLPGIRVYDPKTEENLKAGPSGYGGERRWEYVLVPDSVGTQPIGPLEFHYFDPVKKRYVRLEAGPLVLDVTPSEETESELETIRGLRGLKPLPESPGEGRAPFHRSAVFYASLLLPVVWNLGLVAYRKKRESERAQETLFRSRRAHKMARRRLRKAARLARQESMLFYEELTTALYRYVADKLGEGSSALTLRRIDELLAKREVPESARATCLRAIEEGEFARFTPGRRSREEMASLLRGAEDAVVSLENHLG